MTSKNLKSAIWLTLAVSATAFAVGGPPPGKGGGGPPAVESSNNLSVPTIMLGGGSFEGVTCGESATWSDLIAPSGEPIDGYELDPDAYYFVQGVNKWQAPCANYSSGTDLLVSGAWGDNLTGSASLKVGSQVRVELVLTDATSGAQSYQGYTVVKLEPDKLDRESAYGTLASGEPGSFYATPEPMIPGVFDGQARLEIVKVGGEVVVEDHLVKAEINAGGRVVYGYNLRVTEQGKYEITFTMPNVTFNDCDAGTCTGGTATLEITVGAGGGKKGGGKP